MVILLINVPDYNETISLTVENTLTVRQLIFKLRTTLEEKGRTIEDIINWGLYYVPKCKFKISYLYKNKINKTN